MTPAELEAATWQQMADEIARLQARVEALTEAGLRASRALLPFATRGGDESCTDADCMNAYQAFAKISSALAAYEANK